MQWIETEVKLKDLIEFNQNPRRIGKEQFERLVKSIKEDGFHQRILVDVDNVIIGGHQRKKALKAAGFKDSDIIKVLKPERKLTEEEFKRLNIRDNGSFGEWDMDSLANLDLEIEELIDWGVPEGLFKDIEFTPQLEEVAPKDANLIDKTTNKHTCPACGHEMLNNS